MTRGTDAASSAREGWVRPVSKLPMVFVLVASVSGARLSAQMLPPSTAEKPKDGSAFQGAFPKPVFEPEKAPAEKIAEIAVKGGKLVGPETISFYLGVKAGDVYDEETLRKGFLRLWDSSLFDDLRLEKETVPGGVRLVAVVVERPKVSDLEFRGNKKLTSSQLKDKLKEGKAEIKVGSPLSLRDVSKAKAALIDAYRADGFRSAAVDTTVEAINDKESRVVFLVDEGDKIKIEAIRFTGNTIVKQARLRFAMKKTRQAHWWYFWDSKDVYSQASYEEDVESLRKVYQDLGYKDVVVKDPTIDTFVANPKEKRPDKVKRRARITIPIVEGERFYFGELKVEGATQFDDRLLGRIFSYVPGRPLKRAVIVGGMKAIDSLYRERGYIYVYMNPEYTERPGKKVDVTVKLTEGDQYRLGRVEFTGNKMTRDKVLRRELLVREGDIVDMEAFKKGLLKVSQLGYFKVEEDPEFRVNPEKKTVDVTVKGNDVNRNEIQFGAGYSQLDGLFGQFQFSTRNFLGRGDTIGFQFQRGARTNFFDVSFSEPWFLDQKMSVGASVFDRSLTYLDVDQSTKGVNLSWGVGLGIWDVVSIFYGYTDTHSKYQVYPPPGPPGSGMPPIAYADYVGRISSITPGYRYDSRNDPFDPTRGKKFGFSVAIAGGPLGADFSYIKPNANATLYVPTGKSTNFAFNLEGGMIRPYNGSAIPIFERYRIGGDRSVRGFQYGEIFPIDNKNHAFFDENGALLGGDKFLVFNAEWVVSFGGPLKIAAFFDAGNAWLEGQTVNPLTMRSSAGLELRIFLPIFQAPLRFIYGINLDPKTILDKDGIALPNGQEKRSDFQFSIGTTF
jgi:outer membrane protein insertion porin family